MASKRQRANRATRRELWRDDMVSIGLTEKTLGVWRWEKGGIDFYPSKLKAYNFVLRKYVDWDIALNMVKGEE